MTMSKATETNFDEYKYHNWKLCQLSLDFLLSSLSHSPLEIQVEVTTHCNIQCIMCTRPYFVTRPKHLHYDVLSKLLPLFPNAVKVVPFGGGEPLIYPHFREVVEHAKHCQAQVTFNTNGVLLNEKLSEKFISLGVDMITLSLDGVRENTYEAIRKKSNHSKVIDNLNTLVELKKEYKKSKPVIGLAFVPMVDNFREIPELFYLASKLGIRLLFFETLLSPDSDWDNTYKDFYHQHALSNLNQDERVTLLQEYATLAKKLNLLIYPPDYFSSSYKKQEDAIFQKDDETPHQTSPSQSGNYVPNGRENKNPKKIACTLPWTSIFVNVDGLVQACCFSSRVFGDLKVQEFSEIWNGREFQHYRNQIINQEYPDECRNCLANGRNRETIPRTTKQQLWSSWKGNTQELWSSWKGNTQEIIDRLYQKVIRMTSA